MTETEDVKNIQEAPEANESLEESFARLDVLAERLEDPKTSLEESFRLYRQGMELLKLCSEKLDTVEKKMLQLNEDGTYSEF